MIYRLILSISLLFPFFINGQILFSEKVSKKALSYFTKADLYLTNMDYKNAQLELAKAIKEEPQFTDAIFLSAEIHYDRKEYALARSKFLKAKSLYSLLPNVTNFKIGNSAFKLNNFTQAEQYLNNYLSGDKVTPKKKIIAEELLENCAFGIVAKKSPVDFKPILFIALTVFLSFTSKFFPSCDFGTT